MSDAYSEQTVDWRLGKNLPPATVVTPPVVTTPATASTPAIPTVTAPTTNPLVSGIQGLFSNAFNTTNKVAEPKPLTTVPTLSLPSLSLPSLTLSDGTSVVNQLNKLNSKDSLTNQQATTQAHEQGTASGGIHSSQYGGAVQRAITDKNAVLAQSEANRQATEETTNFANKVTEATSNFANQTQQKLQEYEKTYTERINQLGYSAERQAYMAQASTSLSNAFLASMTSITNNTDLDISQNLIDRFSKIFNTAMDNNNLILNMGFKY